MKKLEKYNVASEKNKEQLRSAKVDQVVECFPNTLLKLLPNTITKIKWSKKPNEIENWDDWWEIHQKILTPLKAQVQYIGRFFTLLEVNTSFEEPHFLEYQLRLIVYSYQIEKFKDNIVPSKMHE